VLVVLILAPHPSWLLVLVKYHLLFLQEPLTFTTHLLVAYTFTFMAFSSLIVCVARDPGPTGHRHQTNGELDEVGLTEALMAPEVNATGSQKWCRKCWVCPTVCCCSFILVLKFAENLGSKTRTYAPL
jgi:hypothetical protein